MLDNREQKQRKIVHVDMDCFYAAIEIRDNPAELVNKPVAVGGAADRRGVICTCNYIARRYGIHSAMPTALASRRCPQLVILPVNMPKYREVAKHIHAIFHEFTDLVEPLALDEAYLDVSDSVDCQGSATLIAKEIRNKIWHVERLIASVGVAPNKFLAKIASGWRKPNGFVVIRPVDVAEFIKMLPVDELYGVGKVTAEKLHRLQLKTCTDLQKLSLTELMGQFGKLGQHLYEQCRGIDHRPVDPNKVRKSLSVEHTLLVDSHDIDACLLHINELYQKLLIRIAEQAPQRTLKSQFIKLKFFDFKIVTAETSSHIADLTCFLKLFRETYYKVNKPIRLIGLGVHFKNC